MNDEISTDNVFLRKFLGVTAEEMFIISLVYRRQSIPGNDGYCCLTKEGIENEYGFSNAEAGFEVINKLIVRGIITYDSENPFRFKTTKLLNTVFFEYLWPNQDFEQKPTADKNRVYIMIDDNTGYHKIGRSTNPIKREKTLQSEKPTIRLVFHTVANPAKEAELHQLYSNKRVRGEWFDLSEEDIENIKAILQ